MALLERDSELAALQEHLAAARGGSGRLVWVQGEAGIGKTTLVDRFCAGVRGARVVHGVCDPMVTPRALGPVLDIAGRLGMLDVALGEAVSREQLFRGFLDELSSRSWVTVAVIEDAHWADEATLDLLRYTGRRIAGARALLIVTFRDDELGTDHPLRATVGDLATTPGVDRLELGPLSLQAITELAAPSPDVDVNALHAQTGGNPFFVTEVLAAAGRLVPATVRDAVLARVGRLSPPVRAVVDACAVVPTRAETWLVAALAGGRDSEVDEAVGSGVLRPDVAGTVAFRHELARRAVDEAFPPARRAALHAAAASLLRERYGERAEAARIAHHAEEAGDRDTARRYAIRAARRATELGAHREAVAQFERALRHADELDGAAAAELLEGLADAAAATDRSETALEAATRAVALRRTLGDARRLGGALQLLASQQWGCGHSAEAAATNLEAIHLLEHLEAGVELAAAYAGAATFAMLARDHRATLDWGTKAVALAERLGDAQALARALNSVGSSKIINGDPSGPDDLRRSIAVATDAGLVQAVATGWSNLGSGSGEVRDYPVAEEALRASVRVATEHDLDANVHYSTAWLARVRFERGDWDEAASLIASLPLDRTQISPITTIVARTVLGRLRARRGEDHERDLDVACSRAVATGDLQRLWPVAAARAEAAWLAGDVGSIPGLVDDAYTLANHLGHRWAIGELALWRKRAGIEETVIEGAAEPWQLQLADRPTDAAAAWRAIGCPYEAGDALGASDDPADLRESLTVFDRFGAVAAADVVRRRLRELGVRGVPRGPRAATAASPVGLTPRQTEVLDLLARGLSDAGIAARLHLAPKTVGHHVSAILDKLEVGSRGEAAHRARTLGLVATDR
jgi:DNA-binding CsgD family transcriptional regulator